MHKPPPDASKQAAGADQPGAGDRHVPAPQPDPAPDSAPAGPPPASPPRQPPGPQRPAKRAGSQQAEKKRRKTSDIDESFRLVEAALALPAPPLLPTPQSLFRMLCGVFELEFPGRLPQQAVDDALLALDAKK
jgi:hypothetical protein